MMFLGLDTAQLAALLAWGEYSGLTPRYCTDFEKVLRLRTHWELSAGADPERRPLTFEISDKHRRYAAAIMRSAQALFDRHRRPVP